MRTWLYNRATGLLAAQSAAWQSVKILSSGAADQAKPPFIILSMGVEQQVFGMPAEARTQTIPFTFWVHDKPGSMLFIDEGSVILKNGIPTDDGVVAGGMSILKVEWTDTGGDSYDDFFKTNCRPVRFTMTTHR